MVKTKVVHFCAAIAGILLALPPSSHAQYIVTDGQVVAGIYEFLYSPKTNSADSGGLIVAGNPWLAPTGWTHQPVRVGIPAVGYWRLPGASTFSGYDGPGVSGRVGFDFSGISGSIQKVEIDPSHHLFCYNNDAVGHTITGEVATPANFGGGGFSQMYHFVGPAAGPVTCPPPASVGPVSRSDAQANIMLDITGFLPMAWLNNPGLLEFQFGHGKGSGPTIVAENAQVFREDVFHKVGAVPYGFRLRVEVVDSVDSDGDGVSDRIDVCPETAIPEGVPSDSLGVNRWALTDEDGQFDTTAPKGGGKGPELEFSTEDTAGCSCEQIIEALDLGQGHVKFGCSISAIESFVELLNP